MRSTSSYTSTARGVDPSTVDLYVETIDDTSNSGTLTVRVIARRYFAFGERLPASVGVLSGTGLVAPTP